MKLSLLFLPVVVASCAPKAIVLIDGATAGSGPAVASPTENPSTPSNGQTTNSDSRTASNGIGLLDPNLTNLPNEREMRPTVTTNEGNPVIADPPGANE